MKINSWVTIVLLILISIGDLWAQNKTKTEQKIMTEQHGLETATLAAGCFWCVEAIYQQLDGVESVVSGYAGGEVKNPTYEEVCTGQTGHAEVVQIKYDSNKVSFLEVLEVFFKTHDPTSVNRQGADIGTQYRSAIFYHNESQKQVSGQVIDELNELGAYNSKIVTTLEPFEELFVAEQYHQNYFNQNSDKNPYCQMVVRPKVEKFQKVFKDKLKR